MYDFLGSSNMWVREREREREREKGGGRGGGLVALTMCFFASDGDGAHEFRFWVGLVREVTNPIKPLWLWQ